MISSFSRALLEGLRHQQSDEEFNQAFASSIEKNFYASVTG
jgi:fructose-bisphosphate aldolase class 1